MSVRRKSGNFFYLYQIRLNKQGYDNQRRYWGNADAPLYRFHGNHEGEHREGRVRGKTREEAKAAILNMYPNAEFAR